MKYIKTEWIDNETLITAESLNNIENAIEELSNSDLKLNGRNITSGAQITSKNSVVLGSVTAPGTENTVALGYGTIKDRTNSILAVGNFNAGSNYGGTIGYLSTSQGNGAQFSVGIGASAIGFKYVQLSNISGNTATVEDTANVVVGEVRFHVTGKGTNWGSVAGKITSIDGNTVTFESNIPRNVHGMTVNGKSSGYGHIALGTNSLATGTASVAIGAEAKALHTNSIALGVDTKTTQDNQVALGANVTIGGVPLDEYIRQVIASN